MRFVQMEEIFAKIVDNEITQYPLTLADINNANEPTSTYYYCYPSTKPTCDPVLERVIDEPKVYGDIVIINYRVEKKTLEEIFVTIGLGVGSSITINQVSPELLNAVVVLTKDKVQKRLDEFAQTRGYDDIKSVCTYINSQIPTYLAEAQRALYLRDLTWSCLYEYLTNIQTGAIPLPASCSDIEMILPTLTWEEPVP